MLNQLLQAVIMQTLALSLMACTATQDKSVVATIRFEAGDVTRHDTPITIPVNAEIDDAHRFVLREGEGERLVDLLAQVETVDGQTVLRFIAEGETKPGQTRVFKLHRFPAQSADILPPFHAHVEDDQFVIAPAGNELLRYQITPMKNPKGGDRFPVSAFIHPLRTPSGFVLTDIQPDDHLHHLGLWWTWKFVAVDGKQFNTWELQQGEGVMRGRRIVAHGAGDACAWFTAENGFIDRKHQPEHEVLREQVEIAVWRPILGDARHHYVVDFVIDHTPTVNEAVEIVKNRYSGFSLRGPEPWKNDNSTVLTSEGDNRDSSYGTTAHWVRVEGETDNGSAGMLMFSHPDNNAHPEKLYTWRSNSLDGTIFVNFNPVIEESLTIAPGETYRRKYRLIVYDGTCDPATAEALWRDYANPPKVTVE